MDTFDPVQVITTATTALGTQLTGVAGIGLGVGVGIFALTKGWSLLRRFVS
jgi:hypothetical protein